MLNSYYTKAFLTFVLTALIGTCINAQPFKVGKIKAEDFLSMPYEKDPEASAVYIYNCGSINMRVHSNKGTFYYEYERSFRMQILNEDGLDYADIEVPLYQASSGRETISSFRAYVHNLENGKVKSTKLKRRAPITEETSENIKTWKLAFPEVKVGSIIEARYTVRSPYIFSLRPWQFQYGIPVEYSEFEKRVFEYYNYRMYLQGYETVSSMDANTYNEHIHLRGALFQSTSKNQKWIMKDIKALKPEPYTNNIMNYVSLLHFELESEIWPGYTPELYISTWADVDKRLRDSDYFGDCLEADRRLKSSIEHIRIEGKSEKEKIASALSFIHENIRWNNSSGKFASDKSYNILKDGTGNSADINLTLIAILKELGLKAYPVVSSTRSNGIVIQPFPTLSRLNYVLAAVQTEEHGLLLIDGTDKYCPIGMLPKRIMNGHGRMLTETRAKWIDLSPNVTANVNQNYHITLDENNSFTGKLVKENKDFASYLVRSEILKLNDDEVYVETIIEDIPGLSISSYDIENRDDISEPLIEKVDFNLSEGIQQAGDLTMFYPLIHERIEENPFKIEERVYPVDFINPIKEELDFVFDIPEGYTIDFIPENTSFSFKNFGNYSFTTNINEEGQIEVKSVFEMKTNFVLAENYKELKDFYRKIVDKHSEQIVLKKEI